ncbi:peptide chain release factor 2 [bacterium]|nr:peptide chain release factor 2 [bacterium]
MYELEREQLETIQEQFAHLHSSLDMDGKARRLAEVDALVGAPGLWNNSDNARALLREQTQLKRLVTAAGELKSRLGNAMDFVRLAIEEKDDSLENEIKGEVAAAVAAYEQFEFQRTLSGELDANNAYLTIHAGAGGTEACDWVQMLFRMYTRWCEERGLKWSLIDSLAGEGAGYKSVTAYITGEYAFGYLKAERGVHRLVRISPYDANKRRHTSFASVDVTAEVDENIDIDINEKDLRVDTYRSSGAGGQHVNVTDSAVRITHLPTNTVVTCQNERSQIKNRAVAMKLLRAKLYQIELDKREKLASQEYASKQKIEWGSQIRSYVLHPYSLVKDLRTDVETSNAQAVLDGDIDEFIKAYLRATARAN